MKSNIISIILVFKNQRELAEQTLTAIYENVTIPFDVFVVDDASDDGTADTLRSVIEYYAHDETYFFENQVSRGRALCIQDLIPQCSAPVLWLPVGFTTVKGGALRIAIEQLRNSETLFAVPIDAELPDSVTEWIQLTHSDFRLESGKLPDDNQFLINLRGMKATEIFVNPYQKGWFALEWLFRTLWIHDDGVEQGRPLVQSSERACIRVSDFVHAIDDRHPSVAKTASLEIGTLLQRHGYLPGDGNFKANVQQDCTSDDAISSDEDVKHASILYADNNDDFTEKTDSLEVLLDGEDTPAPETIQDGEDTPDTDTSQKAEDTPAAETDISRYTAAFLENDEAPVGTGSVVSPEPDQPPRPKAKMHVLSPFGKRSGNTLDAGNSPVAASLKPRLEKLFEDGEFPIALKEISEATKTYPEDIDLIRIQIIVLERMRRYVEAAELKHKLKNGLTEFKVRKEKILVVDPSDDTGVRAVHDEQAERFPSRPLTKPVTKPEVVDMKQDVSKAETRASAETEPSTISESTVERGADRPDEEADSVAVAPQLNSEDSVLQTESASDDDGSVTDSGKNQSPPPTPPPTTRFTSKPVTVSDPSKTRISYIIPTTGDGKNLLESALFSLSRTSMLPDRELIIIDNASLDETYRYLNQLRKDQFMNIRVITNTENLGFAASVNQGMDIARGEYVFVMHNDVQLDNDAAGLMADLIDIFDDIDAIGPVSNVSFNSDQRMHQPENDVESIRYADYIDSFAMLIRRSNGLRFDPQYEAAYFEDVDYCQQVRNSGKRVAIARGIGVEHRGGATATTIGLEPNGKQYWKNLALFNEKWNVNPSLPFFGDEASPVFQLITISESINPFYPEKEMLAHAHRLLTSETRHEIVQTRHARNDLYALIRLMMVLDIRDVLRQLEQQLDDHDLDDQLRYDLIDFYYRKHIYSRGEKYLNELSQSRKSFEFRLLQLKILMGDKKLEEAAVLVNKLMDERPTHPELFKITADMHKLSGNREEASRFYILAHQANPFVYSPRRDLQGG